MHIGRVSHLQELEIWKTERSQTFQIELLESTQNLKVIFLKNFITHGWMSYATCGFSKVRGWAKRKS